MVISKCVPIEISRKKFSKFDESTNPEEMIFVGYKENDDSTKKNIRLHYDTIKEDIKEYVVQYIEEMGGIAPKPEGVEYVEYDGLGTIPLRCGITVGEDGATHQALEDVSLMRGLPNMTVIVPSDCNECEQVMEFAAKHEGPVYIRLSRNNRYNCRK